MNEATQLALHDLSELGAMHDTPRLLIEWSSPWQEFVTALGPALSRSPQRLAGEARTGVFPHREMLGAWVVEFVLLTATIVLPAKFASMQPYTPVARQKYDVIYFSGDELPQTRDAGGTPTGRSGRAGGHEGYHRTQTIRVARGDKPTEKVVDVPKINLPKSDQPVANLLAINRVPGPPPTSGLRSSLPAIPQMTAVAPPPDVSREKIRTPLLKSSIVAPPPEVSRERIKTPMALNAGIVPPAPSVPRESDRLLPTSPTAVVPPPVSAPESASSLSSRLSLPVPSVVAPPPSNVTAKASSLSGTPLTDLQKQVVPPPSNVVGGSGSSLAAAQMSDLPKQVVAPPVQLGGQVSGRGGGLTISANVVPPPPTVSGGTSATGRGRGNSGTGLGGWLDIGSAVAPATGGSGNSNHTGVVISSQPGTRVGVPGTGGRGSKAMSPAGGGKSGVGGSGDGSSIGRGNGPGSGLEGTGAGAGKTGLGRGSETTARAGISPYPGSGGAGNGASGASTTPGISVRGGNTITLPSFAGNGDPPNVSGHSTVGEHHGPDITVVATSHSGGAFNFYGALKGDKVYTIYITTSLGLAVLQFSDPTSARHTYAEELTAPEPIRADVPAGLTHSRLVIACILDRTGLLRNLRVLEPGAADMDSKILAALSSWKFRPAFRGTQPVEVNAILGFGIDTR